jgi:hypothetical protein
MNCQERQAELIELARSGSPRHSSLASHLEVCAECSRFLDGQLALKAALASLVAETASTPEDLEAKVLSEFDASTRTSSRERWWFPARAAALAAALVAAALLIHRPAPVPQPAGVFVRIPYVAPLAPYERTRMLRMDVPVTALIAVGFEVHARDIGAADTADLLIGQDGRVYAIRRVSSSNPNPDRRVNQ